MGIEASRRVEGGGNARFSGAVEEKTFFSKLIRLIL